MMIQEVWTAQESVFCAISIFLCVVSLEEGIDIALLNLIIVGAVRRMFRSQPVTRT